MEESVNRKAVETEDMKTYFLSSPRTMLCKKSQEKRVTVQNLDKIIADKTGPLAPKDHPAEGKQQVINIPYLLPQCIPKAIDSFEDFMTF